MFQKITNVLTVAVNAPDGSPVDLSEYSGIECYIAQGQIEKKYTDVTIVSGTTNTLQVTIPAEDAMDFTHDYAYFQIAMTKTGAAAPVACKPKKFDIYRFLWEEGYGV